MDEKQKAEEFAPGMEVRYGLIWPIEAGLNRETYLELISRYVERAQEWVNLPQADELAKVWTAYCDGLVRSTYVSECAYNMMQELRATGDYTPTVYPQGDAEKQRHYGIRALYNLFWCDVSLIKVVLEMYYRHGRLVSDEALLQEFVQVWLPTLYYDFGEWLMRLANTCPYYDEGDTDDLADYMDEAFGITPPMRLLEEIINQLALLPFNENGEPDYW